MRRFFTPLQTPRAATLLTGVFALLLATPLLAQTASTKKELAGRIVQLQMPGIISIAQGLVERPAALMLQDAGQAMQKRIAVDKREAASKRVQDSVKKYVDEAGPLVKARAIKLAPSVLGAELEAKFSEEELTQLIAWMESPVSRKFQQTMPQIQDAFMQKLVAESRPLIDPKLMTLEQEIRDTLGLPAAPAGNKSSAKPSADEQAPKSK